MTMYDPSQMHARHGRQHTVCHPNVIESCLSLVGHAPEGVQQTTSGQLPESRALVVNSSSNDRLRASFGEEAGFYRRFSHP